VHYNNRTILIIDDDLQLSKSLEILLNQHDYNVILAENGERGLELLHKIKPSLILIDYFMPKMNGITTIQKIKNRNELKHIPIIMMSSDLINNQGYPFIRKPFKISILLSKIEDLLSTQYIFS
jgi:DNA-binding response OmpR family regulator